MLSYKPKYLWGVKTTRALCRVTDTALERYKHKQFDAFMFWCYWWVWMVWMIVSGLLVCRLCPPAIVLMPTRACKNCISEELPVFHHNCTVSSCTLREALALHCWHWVTRPLLPRGSIVLVYLARYQIRPDQTISPYHLRPLVTLSSTHSEPNQTKSNQVSQDLQLWKR